MNWNSASEFFTMGGYGLFVWGSYGVTLIVMLLEPWFALRRHGRARGEVASAARQED
jgi:heme exporter protein D